MSLFAPGLRLRVNCGFSVLIAIALGLAVFATWKLSAVRDSVARLGAENDYSTQVLEVGDRHAEQYNAKRSARPSSFNVCRDGRRRLDRRRPIRADHAGRPPHLVRG